MLGHVPAPQDSRIKGHIVPNEHVNLQNPINIQQLFKPVIFMTVIDLNETGMRGGNGGEVVRSAGETG